MQNYEKNIINYIDNCKHSDDEKAIFIDLLLELVRYCHQNCDNQSSKTLKHLFPEEQWEQIHQSNRNTLGKHVRHLVSRRGLPLTDTDERTSSNHRLYIVINKEA